MGVCHFRHAGATDRSTESLHCDHHHTNAQTADGHKLDLREPGRVWLPDGDGRDPTCCGRQHLVVLQGTRPVISSVYQLYFSVDHGAHSPAYVRPICVHTSCVALRGSDATRAGLCSSRLDLVDIDIRCLHSLRVGPGIFWAWRNRSREGRAQRTHLQHRVPGGVLLPSARGHCVNGCSHVVHCSQTKPSYLPTQLAQRTTRANLGSTCGAQAQSSLDVRDDLTGVFLLLAAVLPLPLDTRRLVVTYMGNVADV